MMWWADRVTDAPACRGAQRRKGRRDRFDRDGL